MFLGMPGFMSTIEDSSIPAEGLSNCCCAGWVEAGPEAVLDEGSSAAEDEAEDLGLPLPPPNRFLSFSLCEPSPKRRFFSSASMSFCSWVTE